MQQRLPDMREVDIDQGDACPFAFAQGTTETGCQLQATCPAADNDDVMLHGFLLVTLNFIPARCVCFGLACCLRQGSIIFCVARLLLNTGPLLSD
jgi:hypothetical protein